MQKSTTKSLSVVIPTYNCESKIRKCLESVKWADEIIIVDMFSTDRTIDIVKKYATKIFRRIPKDGNFDYNRKYGMEKSKCDWILKLDSDEVLSKELQSEIKTFLTKNNTDYDGYNFYNKIFMLGKQVKYGFIKPGSHELRLVRKGAWTYDPYKYHQLIKVKGSVGFFNNSYDHYVFDTVGEFMNKTNKYTDLDASFLKDTMRVNILTVMAAPYKSFVKLFFIQKGFMDGRLGLMSCTLFSIYNLVEKLKIWHKQNFPLL